MSKSILNILDNDCIETSPCKNCHWHIQGIEKNRCVKICQRLSAYRDNLGYDHLPWPELKDLQDEETEDKIPPKNEKHKAKLSHTDQKKEKIGDMLDIEKTSVKGGTNVDKIVDNIADRIDNRQKAKTGETWKQKTCVICHDETKMILNKRSQTCAACYQAWVVGKLAHPTLGKFKPSLTKSKIKVAAIKKVYVDPPIPKPQKPKKPNRDKVFKIYMVKYPEIMQYIVETAEKSLLPTKDVFIQLLSEAIIDRKRKKTNDPPNL